MKRRDRLFELINTRFDGRQADFARKVHRSPSVIWQYLSGHREMGEKFARHVEQACHLPIGWLDGDEAAPPLVANSKYESLVTLLDGLSSIIHNADPLLKHEVISLTMRYLENPKSDTRIAHAIDQLLSNSGGVHA